MVGGIKSKTGNIQLTTDCRTMGNGIILMTTAICRLVGLKSPQNGINYMQTAICKQPVLHWVMELLIILMKMALASIDGKG
jgi:hypothetical protein